jgi:hypothetical protein
MDKNALIAPRTVETREVEIPGVGTVTVRGFTRYELQLAGKNTEDASLVERRLLSYTMVDPDMSEADVESWQMNSPAGEIGPVVLAMRELSGMVEGAAKSNVDQLRD